MAWNWSRKTTEDANRVRGSLGLDLNASRVRAATGKSARNRPFLLDDPHLDLPLAISMEKRTLEIGRPATALIRRLPHLVCTGYLPLLGQSREWQAGRHRLDPASALAFTFEKLRNSCSTYESIFLGLPSYLTHPQIAKLIAIAASNQFPVKGTASTPLAIAADRAAALHPFLPTQEETKQEWVVPLHRPGKCSLPADVIVVDADEHALTTNLVRIDPDQVRLMATTAFPHLGTKIWKEKLLDSFSDRSVRVCRRDPRDSAEAEQFLYDQIEESFDPIRLGQKVVLTLRSAHWYQDLELLPTDYESYCATLIRQTVEGIRELCHAGALPEPPRTVWLTHEAGRLPGLVQALHQELAERTSVGVLRPEAAAIAIANLGERWQTGDPRLARTHLDAVIPLPLALPEGRSSVKSHR